MAEKSWSLGRALRGMFVKPTIDEDTWDDLETALLTADFGPDITEPMIDELREKVDRYHTTDPKDLQRMLRETSRSASRSSTRRSSSPSAPRSCSSSASTASARRRRSASSRSSSRTTGARWSSARPTRSARPRSSRWRPGRARGRGDRPAAASGAGSRIRRLPDRRVREDRRHRDRAHRHGRPAAHQGRPDGRARARSRRVVEKQAPIAEVLLVLDATTGQNGVAAGARRSSSTPASPGSCSRSSTARRRAGSCSPCRRRPASRSS